MDLKKRKRGVAALLVLYIFAVIEIILVKHPRFFLWRMVETFYRHHFQQIGVHANYRPFHTLWYLTVTDFQFGHWFINIIGNIVLFVPAGIFLPIWFNQPYKASKTIFTCFLLSTGCEIFQLLTACGFFDVDDIFLNTLGGAAGMYIYRLFINHSNYTQKKMVVTHTPSFIGQS